MARRAEGASRRSAGAQSTGRSATTATAPRRAASAAKAWPSAFAPGRAKKSAPGTTWRESPVTRRTSGSAAESAHRAAYRSITLERVISVGWPRARSLGSCGPAWPDAPAHDITRVGRVLAAPASLDRRIRPADGDWAVTRPEPSMSASSPCASSSRMAVRAGRPESGGHDHCALAGGRRAGGELHRRAGSGSASASACASDRLGLGGRRQRRPGRRHAQHLQGVLGNLLEGGGGHLAAVDLPLRLVDEDADGDPWRVERGEADEGAEVAVGRVAAGDGVRLLGRARLAGLPASRRAAPGARSPSRAR